MKPFTHDHNLTRVSAARRWGPLALVMVTLVSMTAVATIKGRSATPDTAVTAAAPVAELAGDPRRPVTYAAAQKAGQVVDHEWGERCDTATGRLRIETVYQPPCVPVWGGARPWTNQGGQAVADNGGATAAGVDAETITIVFYVPGPTDLYSLAQSFGVLDPYDLMEKTLRDLVEAGNATYETYGRKVVVKKFQGSGNGKDPTAARADALRVINEEKAFASIGSPTQTTAYQDTLAENGVLCIACSLAATEARYQANAPHNWGTNPTLEQNLAGALEFVQTNLAGRPARFAGDDDLKTKPRKIGIVHYEQDPPVFGETRQKLVEEFTGKGLDVGLDATYVLDMATLNTQAQTLVGRLKSAGVTTVVHVGDPVMPKILSEEATRQEFFPEWMITGSVFTDSTALGRLMDKRQWAHAFGVSSLAARMTPDQSVAWRFYTWFHGKDPEGRKSVGLLYPGVQTLFAGIHGAGPQLTVDTFAGALFDFPPSGGEVHAPRISYGTPRPDKTTDFTGVDDYTVVWWDASATGSDEQGRTGAGMWAYVDGGRRYKLGETPTIGDDVLFDDEGAVTLLEQRPGGSAMLPPWPGSPAAGGR